METMFEEFLVGHPKQAAMAAHDAVEGYLARKDPIPETAEVYELTVSGRDVRLREDRSHLWAYDPEDSYGDDAPRTGRQTARNPEVVRQGSGDRNRRRAWWAGGRSRCSGRGCSRRPRNAATDCWT